jgi:transcriptional regulator with XRE-family HTH domain
MKRDPFYPNLRRAIYDKYFNQNEFAKVASAHFSTVSAVISGRLNPTDVQKEKWAKLLGKSVEELFKPAVSFADYKEEE